METIPITTTMTNMNLNIVLMKFINYNITLFSEIQREEKVSCCELGDNYETYVVALQENQIEALEKKH